MKKRLISWVLVLMFCLTAAVPALAGNVFTFRQKPIEVFEGETIPTELIREGNYGGDGEIVYASARPAVATVSGDGMVTGVTKGSTQISAILMRNGKQAGKTQVTVNVLRAVTKVTLNTSKMSVYRPDDPAVADLLREQTDNQVLVIPAGVTVALAATCTPTDASGKRVTFTSSDAGVARVTGANLKAVQRGECDLVVASVLNPDVTETFRVLVIQPVKSIQINAGSKQVAAGSTLQLTAACLPENASIPQVVWSSRSMQVATVDENGVVTGLKRGYVTIVASAADGSRAAQSIQLTVTQPAKSVSITPAEVPVIVGRTAPAKATVLPADATDKNVTWSVSDETIATVTKYGQLTGVKAGECTLYATSISNPEVQAEARVVVSQLVTKVENANDPAETSIKVGERVQTRWNILPEDATVTALTFKSNYPKVAAVDENGMVTGLNKGVATIVATSKDSGRRYGTVKITVIQPVTGVSMKLPLYYVQRSASRTIQAVVEPRNANNQKVRWVSANEYIATVNSNGTSTGKVGGVASGTTTVTAITEDGGFSAMTTIKVGDFNHAIRIEDLSVNSKNEIKIVLRNVSDFNIKNVHLSIACYDENEEPFVCNKDGEKTYFEADYPYTLAPYDRTVHGSFRFRNYVIDRPLGAVVLTVVSWRDENNITYLIPEYDRPKMQWTRRLYNKKNHGNGVG